MDLNEKWYRKTPITRNVKLRQAILDVFPFDLDKKKADEILEIIVKTMIDGVLTDGFLTIEGLGRFYIHSRGATTKAYGVRGKQGYAGMHTVPPKTYVKFLACKSLRRSMDRERKDA
jgi:nucleoid DNA-binding protein